MTQFRNLNSFQGLRDFPSELYSEPLFWWALGGIAVMFIGGLIVSMFRVR